MQGIVSRKIDLVILYDKPVAPQNTRATACDTETQTNVTNNVIDFIANGSQKYEILVKHGLIRQSGKLD